MTSNASQRHNGSPVDADVKQIHRQNIILELVETERKYVGGLEKMEEYAAALKGVDLPHELKALVFPNIDEVVRVQRRFLQALEEELQKEWSEQRWGQAYLDREQDFRYYTPISVAYLEASDAVREHEDALAALSHLIHATRELTGYIMRPVSRICKYPLLYSSLLRTCTADTGPHFSDLQAGLAASTRVSGRVNDAIRRTEDLHIRACLKLRVRNWKGLDFASFGELVRDDVFFVARGDVEWEYNVFLFETIILFCMDESETPRSRAGTVQIYSQVQTARRGNAPLLVKGHTFLSMRRDPERAPSNANRPAVVPARVFKLPQVNFFFFFFFCGVIAGSSKVPGHPDSPLLVSVPDQTAVCHNRHLPTGAVLWAKCRLLNQPSLQS
ncbi:Guanine-nucleotide exchange factor Cdc24 [Mycena kentingensis (nom. inval.)]|nr:Guanine-nucleotide exchange factor Cdc24 [Mycena kentingensis (nom. inval.)]